MSGMKEGNIQKRNKDSHMVSWLANSLAVHKCIQLKYW